MDKFKALFQGKKGKYVLGVTLIVIVLAFFTLRSRSARDSDVGVSVGDYPSYQGFTQPSGSGGGGSGSGGGSGTETVITDLTDKVAEALKLQQEQQRIADQRLRDAQIQQQMQQQSLMQQMNDALAKELAAMQSKVDQALLSNTATKNTTGYQSSVVIDANNNSVYGVSNPYSGGNAATGAAQPNLGYGGIDYNAAGTTTAQKQAISANEKKLKEDEAFRQAELIRANEVIANRTSAGLDTSSQVKYVDKISNMAPEQPFIPSASKSVGSSSPAPKPAPAPAPVIKQDLFGTKYYKDANGKTVFV